ncbi:enoyl-CoA hydratase/isomerase family protein [Nonomuraea sp. NPDC050556]|uniref:enoyl-CoA hydratase/isomerase family protein n=1 Tax=Nonomuraea sp. NPDC050556 TaxID=3364369 RepID=UPI0037BA70EF
MTMDQDWATTQAKLAQVDTALNALPPPPDRAPEVRAQAAELHAKGRQARSAFVARHGAELHAVLRDGTPARLEELVTRASLIYPGLVPDAAALSGEAGLQQRDKEGLEIDQGILAWGMLRSPEAGATIVEDMLRPTNRALSLLAAYGRTDRLDLGVVQIERRGPVAHVTLANLDVLNAEDDRLVDDLETAVDLALLDDQVEVGVLRGAPMTHPRYPGRRVFCAGINLTRLIAGQISLIDFLLRRELGPLGKIQRGLSIDAPFALGDFGHRREKPWVAAVDTFAIGGGMQMLFAFDHVVAADDAYFSLPAVREGIVPGVANLRLARLVGPRAARRVILGDQRLHATDPDARGLCDDVVASDAVDVAVDRAAQSLRGSAVVANRRMLHLAAEPVDALRTYLAQFAVEQAQRMYHDDVLTAIERNWIARERAR